MNVHQNARLTVSCRVLLVERTLGGREKTRVARELGVSIKTADKWLRRYREEGLEGLKDRGSRPHRMPRATAEVVKVAVLALRRQRLTLATIKTQLRLSRSTVARIAKAGGLSRLSQLEPAPVYRRYERSVPGELLHLDVKKLGRIVQVGHRITGTRVPHNRYPGWECLHVAIDDASRVAYAQILPDESNEAFQTVAALPAKTIPASRTAALVRGEVPGARVRRLKIRGTSILSQATHRQNKESGDLSPDPRSRWAAILDRLIDHYRLKD